MTLKRTIGILIGCYVVHAISGCGVTPLKYYPDFPTQKETIRRLALMTDVIIVDESFGDTSRVDMPLSMDIGREILEPFKAGMLQKGYPVDSTIFTSVGLMLGRNRMFKVVETSTERGISSQDLPAGKPPFYLDASLRIDSARRQAVTSVYKSLVLTSVDHEAQHTVIQDAILLGGLTGEATLCVVFVGGYNSSLIRQQTQATTSHRSTVGGVAVRSVSQVSVTLYLIDTKEGELIWSDQATGMEGTIYREKILTLVAKLIDDLP